MKPERKPPVATRGDQVDLSEAMRQAQDAFQVTYGALHRARSSVQLLRLCLAKMPDTQELEALRHMIEHHLEGITDG